MRKSLVILILLAVLMAGCSSGANQAAAPPSSPSDANANAAASVGQNASDAAPTAQPSATPTAPVEPAKPELKPNSNADHTLAPNAKPGKPAVAAGKGPAPKLVLPVNKIDFGQVYQNVSLIRKLVVKNAGNAALKIESVVPS
jgi:cytoskeletal protein RodZ